MLAVSSISVQAFGEQWTQASKRSVVRLGAPPAWRAKAPTAGLLRGTGGASAAWSFGRRGVGVGQPTPEIGGHLPEEDDEIDRVDVLGESPLRGLLPDRGIDSGLYLLIGDVDVVAKWKGTRVRRSDLRAVDHADRNRRQKSDSHNTDTLQTSG